MTDAETAAALNARGWICQTRRQMLITLGVAMVAGAGFALVCAGAVLGDEVLAWVGSGLSGCACIGAMVDWPYGGRAVS